MPRKIVPTTSTDPYHVRARSHNRELFEVPIAEAWAIYEDYLFLLKNGFGVRIHSFVLMPNHFHMLATFPEGNLSPSMRYFMRETSREFSRGSGRINQSYGSRFGRSVIPTYHYFMNAYKYVYRNPVRAKLCTSVEEYPFSTLHSLCGFQKCAIPLEEDTLLFEPNFSSRTLIWLNQEPNPDLEEEMRIGLKRPIFELKNSSKTRKPSVLIDQLL